MQIIENKLIKEKSIYRKIKFWIYDYVHSKKQYKKKICNMWSGLWFKMIIDL